jgi:hypothetical protein
MKIRFALGLTLLALALLRVDPVFAKNTLLDATDEICTDVKDFLDKQGKTKVRVGQFIGKGPEAGRASASPLLREALRISLQKKKLEVVETGAHYELTGSFQAIEDAQSTKQAVILSVTLDDLRGNERKFTGVASGKAEKYFFENVPDITKVLGISSYIPPGKTEKEQNADLQRNVDHPQCHFDGTRILAGKGAPFAVEILVAPETKGKRQPSDYKVQQPTDKKGLAFVPVKRAEAYGVRLYNLSKFEVAVDLRLDGLNMYYFSEQRDKKTGGPAYRYVIIPPNRYVDIRGWFVTLNDSDEFLVVPREKSVFAQVNAGNPAEVGVITANFHRAWDRKKDRPSDEPANPGDHALSADATGRGQRFQERYEVVDYAVGTFRGSVSVRYTK